jgi:hypothetical protein
MALVKVNSERIAGSHYGECEDCAFARSVGDILMPDLVATAGGDYVRISDGLTYQTLCMATLPRGAIDAIHKFYGGSVEQFGSLEFSLPIDQFVRPEFREHKEPAE